MTENIYLKLGKIIKKARVKACLSVKQLSLKSKVSEKTLHQIEKGVGNPLISTLLKIGKAFNLKLNQLLKDL